MKVTKVMPMKDQVNNIVNYDNIFVVFFTKKVHLCTTNKSHVK